MTLLHTSPALVLLLGWSGALLSFSRGVHPSVCGAIGGLTALGLSLLSAKRMDKRLACVASLLVVLAALGGFFISWRASVEPPLPQAVEGKGVVVMERPWGGRRAFVMNVSGKRWLVYASPALALKEGDSVYLKGFPRRLSEAREPGEFDPHLYWRARGVSGEVLATELKRSGGGGSLLGWWRTRLRRFLLLRLPPRLRGYMSAALLGVRDPELEERHRRWGTVHLLAVSGFHVGLVAVVFRKLFRNVPLAPAWVSACIWFYTLMTGAAPSALRAALMIEAMILAGWIGRPQSPVHSVSLAATVLLLWRPWWFWDVGWRLSVLAALTLASLASVARTWYSAVATSPTVWCTTAAQIAYTFGSVPLGGLIVNLVAIPAFSLLFPLGAAASLLALLPLPLIGWALWGVEFVFALCEFGLSALSKLLPGELVWFPQLSLVSAVTLFALLGRAANLSGLRWLIFLFVALVPFV